MVNPNAVDTRTMTSDQVFTAADTNADNQLDDAEFYAFGQNYVGPLTSARARLCVVFVV